MKIVDLAGRQPGKVMEKTRKIMTLVIVHDHPRILLGMKKRGFGVGKWNGFGGHVEAGETIEEAARRELKEEAGIIAGVIEKIGVNEFSCQEGEDVLEVHIYKTTDFSGIPKESEEMSPRWFFVDEIPFDKMWSSDVYWFPYLMKGKKFYGRYLFDDNDKVVDYSLNEVEDL